VSERHRTSIENHVSSLLISSNIHCCLASHSKKSSLTRVQSCASMRTNDQNERERERERERENDRTRVRASFDAPKSSSIDTISWWPFCDATISGVWSLSSSETKSTGAPLIKSSRAWFVSPCLLAKYNLWPCSCWSIIDAPADAALDACCWALDPSSDPIQSNPIQSIDRIGREGVWLVREYLGEWRMLMIDQWFQSLRGVDHRVREARGCICGGAACGWLVRWRIGDGSIAWDRPHLPRARCWLVFGLLQAREIDQPSRWLLVILMVVEEEMIELLWLWVAISHSRERERRTNHSLQRWSLGDLCCNSYCLSQGRSQWHRFGMRMAARILTYWFDCGIGSFLEKQSSNWFVAIPSSKVQWCCIARGYSIDGGSSLEKQSSNW